MRPGMSLTSAAGGDPRLPASGLPIGGVPGHGAPFRMGYHVASLPRHGARIRRSPQWPSPAGHDWARGADGCAGVPREPARDSYGGDPGRRPGVPRICRQLRGTRSAQGAGPQSAVSETWAHVLHQQGRQRVINHGRDRDSRAPGRAARPQIDRSATLRLYRDLTNNQSFPACESPKMRLRSWPTSGN
jgi:hypothetical protein